MKDESQRVEKTIVVAGGAGFLGSHLCEALLEQGHRVVCVDSYLTGARLNVAHLVDDPYFELVEQDICRPLPLAGPVDQIYNLACPASPPLYQADPVHTLMTNVVGTGNLLELTTRSGATFLQASTSEVYGDPREHPQREDYWGNVNCTGPRACYDEGKRAAEALCFDTMRQMGTDIRVARIFNTYGPRMRPEDGRIVSNLIVQALAGEPLTIYGDGTQTRSFCYVADLVAGLMRLMNVKRNPQGPINLGNPGEFTIIDLARLVIEATGSRSRLVYRPLPQDDPRCRRPDISRAREVLGWQPRVPLAEGLALTIEWFSEQLGKRRPVPHAARRTGETGRRAGLQANPIPGAA